MISIWTNSADWLSLQRPNDEWMEWRRASCLDLWHRPKPICWMYLKSCIKLNKMTSERWRKMWDNKLKENHAKIRQILFNDPTLPIQYCFPVTLKTDYWLKILYWSFSCTVDYDVRSLNKMLGTDVKESVDRICRIF